MVVNDNIHLLIDGINILISVSFHHYYIGFYIPCVLAYFVMQELETTCLLMGDETDHLIGFLVRLFLLSLMRISASISVSSRCSYKRSLLFPTRHNSSHCSSALHRLPLSHLASWRAPESETAGLRNPASCDPVRERGDQVFGERPYGIAGVLFIVAANGDITDDEFPNDDFFPDVNDLFSDMTIGMLGNVVISKNFLRTRKIMVMHSNERGECDLRTLVD